VGDPPAAAASAGSAVRPGVRASVAVFVVLLLGVAPLVSQLVR
jgi:hypothetical protein